MQRSIRGRDIQRTQVKGEVVTVFYKQDGGLPKEEFQLSEYRRLVELRKPGPKPKP